MPGMALGAVRRAGLPGGGVRALLRRPLAYVVTAKGKLRTVESPAHSGCTCCGPLSPRRC